MSPNWIIGTLAVVTVILLAAIEVLHDRKSRLRRRDAAASLRPRDLDP